MAGRIRLAYVAFAFLVPVLAIMAGARDASCCPADSAPAEIVDALLPPLHERWRDEPLPWELPEWLRNPYDGLTEDDYRTVAEELGVETAAIKAVVDVETGQKLQGFYAPGKPLINFDLSIYRRMAPRHGVSVAKARKAEPAVFARPDIRKHGSYQRAQQARLDAACRVDSASALESTFWGMFQIGGFNWRRCGVSDVQEFVRLMSRSEHDQLELFARFISHDGMVDAIRRKDWLQFATKYNGPGARARGYHTRLAAAYKLHKEQEKREVAGRTA